jgi:hypothetical protein
MIKYTENLDIKSDTENLHIKYTENLHMKYTENLHIYFYLFIYKVFAHTYRKYIYWLRPLGYIKYLIIYIDGQNLK